MTDEKEAKEFNDSELQEIMGEIESLEEEFGGDTEANISAAGSDELDLEETERQLAELEGDLDDVVHEENTVINEAEEPYDEEVVNEDPILSEVEELVANDALEQELLDELTVKEPIVEEVVIEAVTEEVIVEEVVEIVEEQPIVEEVEPDNVVTLDSSKTQTNNTVSLGAEGSMNLELKFNVAGNDAILKIEGSELSVEMDGVQFRIDEENGCLFEMSGGVRFQVPLAKKGKISKAS